MNHNIVPNQSHEPDRVAADELRAGFRATVRGALVNIALSLLKAGVGFAIGSRALVADGIHSFGDLISDIVILVSLPVSRQSADSRHQFGHGRFETLVSIFIGLMLVVTSGYIIVDAIRSLDDTSTAVPGGWVMVIAAVGAITKEILYRLTITVGRRIRSLALQSNAWEHRSDALSSLAVLISGTILLIRPAWYWADSVAAIAVALMIVWAGGRFILSGFSELIDTAPDPATINALEAAVLSVDGVRQAHDLRCRLFGSRVLAEIHIEVDATLTIAEGHEIVKQAQDRAGRAVPHLERLTIHVDPVESDQPR